jgi:hypothetical protein
MKTISRSLLVAMGLLAVQMSFAWGVTGHRVVGEIAQRHLSKKAKKGIAEIFGQESLSWWANWPDFIKSDTTHTWDMASKWHYVDLPGHIGKTEFITGLKALPGQNLYTQIPAMINQMKDKSLSIEKRKEALSFLVHMVGDLHQPLHVGRDEDQGGNKITVYWFDKKTNLHSLWDATLIDFQQYSYTEYATELNIASKEQVKSWQQSSLEDWFYESHVLSDKIYDQSPNEAKLSYKYNYIFKKDLDSQLLKGGVRLAELINKAFE